MIILVDVGAVGGIHKRWKNYKVKSILFEPHPESYKRLKRKYKDVRQIAVSNKKGTMDFVICKDSKASSLQMPNTKALSKNYYNPDRFKVKKKIKIEVDTLDNQIKEQIDVLKIDAQGHERQVLEGAKRQLPGIKAVKIKLMYSSTYKNQPTPESIDKLLKQYGFKLHVLSEAKGNGILYNRHLLYYKDFPLIRKIYKF